MLKMTFPEAELWVKGDKQALQLLFNITKLHISSVEKVLL